MSNAGRPALFNSPSDLEKKIEDYFEYIKGEFKIEEHEIKDKKGNTETYKEKITLRDPEHPTITGLAFYLGFASRQSFYDYEKEGEFSYTIKRARLRVESNYEQKLHYQHATGAIFALKNFGWIDKSEVDNRNENYNMNVEVTEEEAIRIKEALSKKI